jgi:hypothetical protein
VIRFLGLLTLATLSACAGVSDYHAVSSYVVANTDTVYVSVGKQNRELTSCENSKSSDCLLVGTKLVYTDSRLVVVDANTGAQHDLVISARPRDFAITGAKTLYPTSLANAAPWTDIKKHPALKVIGPAGQVAYFWYANEGTTPPAQILGTKKNTSVKVGELLNAIYLGANDLTVTLVSPTPLKVAQFRWMGAVDTKLEEVSIAAAQGEYGFEFVSLSPHGESVLMRVLDIENRNQAGEILGYDSNKTKYVVVSLPSGGRESDLTVESGSEFEWVGDKHLAVNNSKLKLAETWIHNVSTSQMTLADEFVDFSGRTVLAGTDVLVTKSAVLTPDGKVTTVDTSAGFVVEGRQGWGLNTEGELVTYDFDRKTSRSLGRLGPSTTLIGKSSAGLIAFDHRTPAKIWTINPDHGARRNVVISTTTANGVEEVSGY